jgi:hypothetical protein
VFSLSRAPQSPSVAAHTLLLLELRAHLSARGQRTHRDREHSHPQGLERDA